MATPTPQSRVAMGPSYEHQLRKRKDDARAAYEARKAGDSPRWDRPRDWGGDAFDYEGMHEALNRDQANDQMGDAIKDGSNPGATGDAVAASVMIDRLSVTERAFKARHTLGRCRSDAAAAAGGVPGTARGTPARRLGWSKRLRRTQK